MLVQSGRKSLSSDSQRRNTDQSQSGLGILALGDLQSMAREEGEGMETTETESLSPAVAPLTSFEHLLTSPDPKQGTFERRPAEFDAILTSGLSQRKAKQKNFQCDGGIPSTVVPFYLDLRLPLSFRAICVECGAYQRGTDSEVEYSHAQHGTHEQPVARDWSHQCCSHGANHCMYTRNNTQPQECEATCAAKCHITACLLWEKSL